MLPQEIYPVTALYREIPARSPGEEVRKRADSFAIFGVLMSTLGTSLPGRMNP